MNKTHKYGIIEWLVCFGIASFFLKILQKEFTKEIGLALLLIFFVILLIKLKPKNKVLWTRKSPTFHPMKYTEIPIWAKNKKSGENLEWDIAFYIVKDVYFGNPNDWQQIQDTTEKYHQKVRIPSYPLIHDCYARSFDIFQNPDELIHHYESVIKACEKNIVTLDRSHSFTISLKLLDGHNQIMSFIDLYEDLPRTKNLMKRILDVENMECFIDSDESWSLYMIRNGSRLLFHTDDGSNESYEREGEAFSMDRELVKKQFAEAVERTEKILQLVQERTGIELRDGGTASLIKKWDEIMHMQKPKISLPYFNDLVRRYKKHEMQNEEHRLFRIELAEQLKEFKETLEAFVSNKITINKVLNIADKVHDRTLLFTYLDSFDGFRQLFNDFLYDVDITTYELSLEPSERKMDKDAAMNRVKELLHKISGIPFP